MHRYLFNFLTKLFYFFQKNNFFFRDIKPKNILLDKSLQNAKITDLGIFLFIVNLFIKKYFYYLIGIAKILENKEKT